MEVLLPLPLALHGVVEELSEGPLGPLQQLVIQQKSVGGLCTTHTHTAPHSHGYAKPLSPRTATLTAHTLKHTTFTHTSYMA